MVHGIIERLDEFIYVYEMADLDRAVINKSENRFRKFRGRTSVL